MRRLLTLVVLACLILAGCGGTVTVQGAINSGVPATKGGTTTTTSASGTVSIVHLSSTSDSQGSSTQVTVVTLVQQGGAQTITFCGSQVSQFPMNTFVSASFVAGNSCNTLVSVTKQ